MFLIYGLSINKLLPTSAIAENVVGIVLDVYMYTYTLKIFMVQ